MKIKDLLNVSAIDLSVSADTKEEVLIKAVELMARQGNISDKNDYLRSVFAREEEGTTGVGDGIAIPHGRCEGVKTPGLVAMVIPDGVDYEALDDEPVNLLFLIAANPKSGSAHIDILSKLSAMLMHEDFTDALRNAKSPEEFLQIIDEAEDARDARDRYEDDREVSARDVSASNASARETNAIADDDRYASVRDHQEKGLNSARQTKILAVTGCPTGIAHTFMAAEALEKSGRAKGCFIKVETRGSGGAKNVLTEQEIKEADCIIVAADTKVPMERFDGKKLIEVPVSDGISKANILIERAINGDANIYHSAGLQGTSQNSISGTSGENVGGSTNGSIGHRIYKHLMNGVSHMLPFVVGGGILIALAFLIDGMSVDLNKIPQDLIDKYGSEYEVKQNFGSLTETAKLLKDIGGTAFNFMLPVLAGFIAMSIVDRPGLAVGFVGGALAANGTSGFLGALVAGFVAGYLVRLIFAVTKGLPSALDGLKPVLIVPLFGILFMGLVMNFVVEPLVGMLNTALENGLESMSNANSIILGLILGGMMAIDMGGPFNKAAYLFGTGMIASGHYDIMAAVMIGGMVPPCAIALATLLFKNNFTIEERKSGPTNFVMGLAFITEGAIPFAAADPLRVLPSCIAGSAVAGGLSMAFKCTLMAPHGGIFVFPVVGNALLYLVSLLAGTVVAALLLGLLKKPLGT